VAEERRVVTILFADVAGSTAMGDALDPEDVRALLRRYYDVARETVTEHGGILEKFIGEEEITVADLKAATAEAPTPTRLFHLARAYYLTRDRSAATKVLTEARDRHGLKLRALHPIEQETCQRLGADLNVKLE